MKELFLPYSVTNRQSSTYYTNFTCTKKIIQIFQYHLIAPKKNKLNKTVFSCISSVN